MQRHVERIHEENQTEKTKKEKKQKAKTKKHKKKAGENEDTRVQRAFFR